MGETIALIGLGILLGYLGARGIKLLKAPLVVGYVIAGAILGPSISGLYSLKFTYALDIFSLVALSLIGFSIGMRLETANLKSVGKSVLAITTLEASGAAIFVTIATGILTNSWGLALILGALSAATAPAGTVEVLREYKAKGIFTTTLYAVVGLDDAAGLIIYGLLSTLAIKLLLHNASISPILVILHSLGEIGLSILLGCIGGFLLGFISKITKGPEDLLLATLGILLPVAGLANVLHLSLILTSMFVGIVLINYFRTAANRISNVLQNFVPPIYIIFFVAVGAKLNIKLLPSMGILGILYIIMRMAGKFAGSYLGAAATKTNPDVRKYLGFGLGSQAGVAIGLAIAAYHTLAPYGGSLAKQGSLIINLITATSFLSLIYGPIMTKYALFKVKEAKKVD